MDDFHRFMNQYIDMELSANEFCEFMMQRMEWNEWCRAIEYEENWYWTISEEEAAYRMLNRRKLYNIEYKPLTYKEIVANAESAGWQNVEYTQELFNALQGLAKTPEENKEMLTSIVEAMAIGMEPREVMELCLPPASKMGRAAYSKLRHILRKVRRQLPDFGIMGYTEEEAEVLFPEQKSTEGIVVIVGNKSTK